MKLILTMILFVGIYMAEAQMYKDYKIQIGNKWYEADGKISREALKEIQTITLRSKLTPSRETKIENTGWSVRYNGSENMQSQVESGNFDFTLKNIPYVSVSEHALKMVKPQGIFMLEKIKVAGTDKNYPTFFRLYFE